jgi:hypothetical protein
MIPTFDLANSLSGGRGDGVGSGGSSPHRYWRIIDIECPDAPPGYFEISEIQVLELDVNVTGDATKTSSSAPDTIGTLADLFDGNLSSRAAWTLVVAEDAAFWIKFDFAGGDVAVDGVKQGGYDNPGRYMQEFTLQWSNNDSDWTTLGTKTGLTYPGNNTLSAEYSF